MLFGAIKCVQHSPGGQAIVLGKHAILGRHAASGRRHATRRNANYGL